ncbi:MAG: hypothetical protein C5B49_08230 [Bdellovibrio sp.]|nr:MAG: hypothetical protein C5B49_08230 [Bdellovibrio sp.]
MKKILFLTIIMIFSQIAGAEEQNCTLRINNGTATYSCAGQLPEVLNATNLKLPGDVSFDQFYSAAIQRVEDKGYKILSCVPLYTTGSGYEFFCTFVR